MNATLPEVLALNVATVVGPVYIANILNWLFMGTLIMQLYTYYQLFPTDKLVLRILVNSLFLVDVAQTISLTMHGWYFAVTTWGDPVKWEVLPWTAAMIPIPCGITGIRSRLRCNHPGVMLLYPPTQQNLIRLHPAFSVWLSGSFVVDTIITGSMTYILAKAKTNTSSAHTEAMLTKVIHRIIQTGAASAVCAAIDLAMFVGFPSTNYHVVPAYILGKMYTNSLMLTLNLRRPTTPRNNTEIDGFDLHSMRFKETPGGNSAGVHVTHTAGTSTERSVSGIWTQKGDESGTLPVERMVNIPKMNIVRRLDTDIAERLAEALRASIDQSVEAYPDV
ncbi:hypothetical protein K438DRAFT_1966594 [Mycena galopus ATCC 62051]|nr:hypothetical protein K438DRAFT_1966594 [Mycena galopus ATCC 62051]